MFGQLIALAVGALCLGVALTIGVICALVNRHSARDSGDGCFGTIVCTIALALATLFFFLAIA